MQIDGIGKRSYIIFAIVTVNVDYRCLEVSINVSCTYFRDY